MNYYKIFTSLLIVILLFNCNSEEINKEKLSESNDGILYKDGKLSFNDFDEFRNKIKTLSEMQTEDLESWIRLNNPKSLYNLFSTKNDFSSDLYNLPNAYKAILNENLEFIISDKIIWLNEQNLYEFNTSDINNIESLKSNINELKPVGSIKLIFYDKEVYDANDSSQTSRVSIGQNTLDARYQHEFGNIYYFDCSGVQKSVGGGMKYVHELVTVQTTYYSSAYSNLYLRIKLEWKGKHWNPASEPRDFNINVNISGTYLRFSNGLIIPTYGSDQVNLNYLCSLNQTILLKSSDSYGLQGGSPYWSVQTTGTIYHTLHSSPYGWTNYFIY